jgi:hypothetical protein
MHFTLSLPSFFGVIGGMLCRFSVAELVNGVSGIVGCRSHYLYLVSTGPLSVASDDTRGRHADSHDPQGRSVGRSVKYCRAPPQEL